MLRKYDDRIFDMFIRTFRELPCAAVIRKLPRSDTDEGSGGNISALSEKTAKRKAKLNRAKRNRSLRLQEKNVNRGEGWGSIPLPGEYRVLVVHGGLFRSWHSKKKVSMELGNLVDLASATRQIEDPSESVIEDVIWSDPQINGTGVKHNVYRGAGILFGTGAAENFFRRNHLCGLIRAHEGPDMRETRPEMDNMLQGYSVDMELASGFVATVFSSAAYRKFIQVFQNPLSLVSLY